MQRLCIGIHQFHQYVHVHLEDTMDADRVFLHEYTAPMHGRLLHISCSSAVFKQNSCTLAYNAHTQFRS